MTAILKAFSQEVNLGKVDQVHYFLVFDISGRECRVPVLKETVEALTDALYFVPGPATKPAPVQEESDIPEGAEEFGGDEELDIPDSTDLEPPNQEPEDDEPMSEEDLPSL